MRDRAGSAHGTLEHRAPILNARGLPKRTACAPWLGIGLPVSEGLAAERLASKRLAEACLQADTAARRLGGPGALMRKLVQELRELLPRDHLGGAVLRKLLERGADLLTDGGVGRHLMGELMQRGGDLLLLNGDLMWLLAELLSETLLAC